MIIDIHTHVTYGRWPEFCKGLGRSPFTVGTLLKRMDWEGIDKSVLLPLTNPENVDVYAAAGNQECLEACGRHPDRLIPFCNIDPRSLRHTPKANLSRLMAVYKDLGCKGIGEVCANLPITHRLCENMFHHAGTQNMPVLFHLAVRRGGTYGVIDKLHLPGLDQTLKRFPDTLFIGHGPGFWNEIDADLAPKDRNRFPNGPIRSEGRLCDLLTAYPNLYADISARSGFNALSRDPEFGYAFLERFNTRIVFGTDRFTSKDEPIPPILTFLKDVRASQRVSKRAYDNIMHRNTRRILEI